jgi:hypothetical protein
MANGSTSMEMETAATRRRINAKNMYRQGSETTKPNTIVVALDENQIKEIKKLRCIDQFVITQTGAQVKGCNLIGQQLFIYPAGQADFEAVWSNNEWSLKANNKKQLENRDHTLILKKINIKEIQESLVIQSELKNMGIIEWRPLIEDDPDYLGVKVKCQSKGHLTDIMNNYYLAGKKFKLLSGLITNVNFNPDVRPPVQCFNCYKFANHMADQCEPSMKTCGYCGMAGHTQNQCAKDGPPKCVNCSGAHESKSKDCTHYIQLKREKISKAMYYVTGEAIARPDEKTKTGYLAAVTRQKAGIAITYKIDAVQEEVHKKVDLIKRGNEESQRRIEQYFEEAKKDSSEAQNSLKAAVSWAQTACQQINENMLKVATEVAHGVKMELKRETAFLAKGLDDLKFSLNTKESNINNRLDYIENYLGKMNNGESFMRNGGSGSNGMSQQFSNSQNGHMYNFNGTNNFLDGLANLHKA